MADLPPRLPEWGTSGSAELEEPSLPKKQRGWTASEKPPHEIFNWLSHLTYLWLLWLSTTVFKYEAGASDPKEVGLKFHPNGDGIGSDAFKVGVTSIEGSGTPSLFDGARVELTGRAPSASLILSWTGKSSATLRTFGLNAPEWDEPVDSASLHHMHGGRGQALVNVTGENGDGGRESPFEFWGSTSGGVRHRLGRVQVEHDGAGDDFKGRMVFAVNAGSVFDDLSASFSLSSDGTFAVDGGIEAGGDLDARDITATGTLTGHNATITTILGANTVSAASIVGGTIIATTSVEAPTVEATTKVIAPNVALAMARVTHLGAGSYAVPGGHGVSLKGVSGLNVTLDLAEDLPSDAITVIATLAGGGASPGVSVDSANNEIAVALAGHADFFIVVYGV